MMLIPEAMFRRKVDIDLHVVGQPQGSHEVLNPRLTESHVRCQASKSNVGAWRQKIRPQLDDLEIVFVYPHDSLHQYLNGPF
jgi:hypothetical protein